MNRNAASADAGRGTDPRRGRAGPRGGAEGERSTGTKADYLVPMAFEMPDIDIGHVNVPLSGTELGAVLGALRKIT